MSAFANALAREEKKSKAETPRVNKQSTLRNCDGALISPYERKEIRDFIDSSWKVLNYKETAKKSMQVVTLKSSKDLSQKHFTNTQSQLERSEKARSPSYTKPGDDSEQVPSSIMITQRLRKLEAEKARARNNFASETDQINSKLERIEKRLNAAAVLSERRSFARSLAATIMMKPQEKIVNSIGRRNAEVESERELKYLKKARVIEDHKVRKGQLLKELQDKVCQEIEKRKKIQAENYTKLQAERAKEQDLLARSIAEQSKVQVQSQLIQVEHKQRAGVLDGEKCFEVSAAGGELRADQTG